MLWVPCQRPKHTHGSIDEQGWIDWLPIEVSKEELKGWDEALGLRTEMEMEGNEEMQEELGLQPEDNWL